MCVYTGRYRYRWSQSAAPRDSPVPPILGAGTVLRKGHFPREARAHTPCTHAVGSDRSKIERRRLIHMPAVSVIFIEGDPRILGLSAPAQGALSSSRPFTQAVFNVSTATFVVARWPGPVLRVAPGAFSAPPRVWLVAVAALARGLGQQLGAAHWVAPLTAAALHIPE